MALKSVQDAGLIPGEDTVVVGAGVIGLMVTRILLLHGFGVTVLGTRSMGLGVAQEAGATVIDVTRGGLPDNGLPADSGPGVDVVIDTSGAPEALEGALRLLRPHGRLVVTSFHGALPVSLSLGAEFHHNALEIVSSQFDWGCGTGSRRWDLERLRVTAERLLAAGIGRGLVTHELDPWVPDVSYRVVREHPGIGYAFTYGREERA
ncbi:zinc-binding dehydrogenase [Aquihabitans sp. G128]|uniref:zinc-binding dehydrogenase n=1 Tax=Aquihabitans sp. G128 TaxID=2849779 RepID=UPI001C248A11|nr:zinc-binding dehydrogenase [Aquihabitans sp. G128]QXC60517.1 zinc-binding dehydrogenase [Aquihabitans sp. G128]